MKIYAKDIIESINSGKIIPYTPDMKITNLESLPKGTGARYLEVIEGQEGTLIAKQWRRKPVDGVILIDFKKVAKGNTSIDTLTWYLSGVPIYNWSNRKW